MTATQVEPLAYPEGRRIEVRRYSLSNGMTMIVGLFGTPYRASGRRFRVELSDGKFLFDTGNHYDIGNAKNSLDRWFTEFLAETGLTVFVE